MTTARESGDPGSPHASEQEAQAVSEQLATVRVRLAEQVAAGQREAPGAPDEPDRTNLALEELVRTLGGLLKADAAVLLLHDPAGDALSLAVRSGSIPPSAFAQPLPPHHTVAARLRGEDVFAVPDLGEDAELAGLFAEQGLDALRAACGAPMRTLGEEFMGLLVLAFAAPRGFRPADLQLVRGSARQAAEIVERARLHAEARLLAERERRHGARLRMLAEAALAISLETDIERMLQLVTEAACEVIGTHQGVTSRLEHGWEHASTYVWLSEKYDAWRDYERVPSGLGVLNFVTRENKPLRLTADELRAHPEFRGLADAPEHPPLPDYLAAPLVARDGSNLGLVQLADKVDGTPFSPEDEAMLVQLAQMASVSIENAELIQRERAARRAAEESARLRGALSDASAAFAASLDLEEVLSAVTTIVVPEYADWCGINLLRSDGEIQMVAESSADEALVSAMAAIRERIRPSLDRPHGVGAVIRTGKSEFFPAVPQEVLRELAASAGVDPQLLFDLRIESGIVVPLLARGRPMGALTLIRSANPVHYTEDELAFAEDLASRAALAIENATRFTLERQAADMLQRSLLPQALPRLPGLQAAARYLPGGAGTRIGGDWYDVIALDEHRMAFVVGDVMGRGISAATVMGQLRSAVRAYAQEGHEPGRLLALVDQLVERLDDLQLTTCIYGVYDSTDGTFTAASAGHPSPLLLLPDGSADYLELPAGLPLGAGSFGDGTREQTVVTLPRGATLLLYTDGLVEARDCPIDEGMGRLRQAAEDCPDDPDVLCDTLLKAMGRDGHHDDDTALLALSVTTTERSGEEGHGLRHAHELTSDLSSPSRARRIVVDTLASWEIEDSDTVVLLTHELVTNAVLHGTAPVVLRLERREHAIRVEVADGSEVPPEVRHYEQDAFTGRGLALVEALARRWGWQLAGRGKVVWCEVEP